MKLALKLLQKMIVLPSEDAGETRRLLDDLGLEVKDVSEDSRGVVFTIETLANRGDHLSALGVAREVAARTLAGVKHPPVVAALPQKKAVFSLRRETDRCLRYALLEAEISPDMKLRPDVGSLLESADALHPLVSILNYVQAEVGQPMHAFDRDKIDGEIIINLTTQEEKIEALDGKSYMVPVDSVVIRDRSKIVAVAGVIGCANSMVTDSTTRVVIESALFEPVSVRKTARKMGLVTEAAYAFERGVDPDGWLLGLKRAGHLLTGLGGGAADPSNHLIGFSTASEIKVELPVIEVPLAFIRTQLGMPRLEEVQISSRLKHLGYSVEVLSATKNKEVLRVVAPAWRVWDVSSLDDVLEDLARSIGYSQIKLELPPLDYAIPELNDRERITSQLEPVLLGNGFLEVITKSFYSAKEAQLVEEYSAGKLPPHLTLKNSLESSYSHLKATNLVHAALMTEQNFRRGVQSIKAFEFGQLFGRDRGHDEEYPHESACLTLWQAGRWMAGEWRQPEKREQRVASFVGLFEQLFAALRAPVTIVDGDHPLLHPGCQGEFRVGRKVCGFFGLIHPGLQLSLIHI